MTSPRRMLSESSSSSAVLNDEIHVFNEEESFINVSAVNVDLIAEFKQSMEAKFLDMRNTVISMNEELRQLRAERDEAVREASKLREMLNAASLDATNSASVRSPTRKVAKVSMAPRGGPPPIADEFPPLPERPKSSLVSSAITNSNASAYAVPASTSRGAAASLKATASVNSKTVAKYKKILQAIDTDVFKVRRVLVDACVHNFEVKQASKKGPVKIIVTKNSDVVKTVKALVDAKISFHEFKTPDEKLKCYVIRGLVGATVEELPFIKEQLCLAGLPEDIKISLHVTGFMRANPSIEMSAPVKMVVPPGFDDKLLLQIKHINHMAVRFELFKSKSIMQCKNCQRFGHSASGCQHQHRCVKCGLNHYRDACPRTLDPTTKLKCCNCGGEHTANNLNNCKFFLERYASTNSTAVPAAPAAAAKTRSTPASIQPGLSYAGAASSNSRPQARNVGMRSRTSNSNKNINDNVNNNNINRNNINSHGMINNNISNFTEAFSMLSGQLGQIMAKLEEHSQMWTRHERLIKVLMSNAFIDIDHE